MKVKINTYEVEVKAKDWDSNRFNKQDTLSFLCHLCVELINARDNYEAHGYEGCSGATQQSIDNIRALLDENHYDPCAKYSK